VRADAFQSSTKLEALREEVARMRAADPGAKAVGFSQFTSMLDLAAFRLHQCGVRTVRLQGGMTMGARAAAVDQFTHDPDVPVMLLSLKAGG
jgi:DNA repair protein RAD16